MNARRLPRSARVLTTLIAGAALAATPAMAHHGVASLGAAALEGPGAPIESATSATLPTGRHLLYLKVDHARYERATRAADGEADYAQFWLLGVGRGFTPWFSGYVFLPYHAKIDERDGFDTRGFADLSVFGQFGFKYDDGFQRLPASESLDDLEDWRFTLFGGASAPTGDPNLRDRNGNIDPGKSTGFGKPSLTLGLTATKLLAPHLTFNAELSYLRFLEYEYDDGNRTQFGDERRVNIGLIYRAFAQPARKLRLDASFEMLYLGLGRDRTNGTGDVATGGQILYALPGMRLYYDNMSLAIGIKKPIASNLNEAGQQQGAEGKEDYRLLISASLLL